MNKKYLVIDLGSTNVKIDQFNQQFTLEKSFSFATNLNEQNSTIDLNYLHQELNKILGNLNQQKNQFLVLFVSAMHSLILVNHQSQVLHTSNLKFNAQRGIETFTKDQLAEIRNINGMIIGNHLPFFRFREWETNRQEIKEIFSLKSYLLKQFTGQNVTDLTDASGFGTLDYRTRKWSPKLLKLVGLTKNQLPKIISNQQLLTSQFENIDFSVGLADGVSASLFVNNVNPNALSISIGTTIGVRKIITTPPQLKNDFDYLIPLANHQYVYGIAFNNGANNLSDFLAQQNLDFQIVSSALKLEDESEDFYFPFAWKERNALLWNKSSNLEILTKKYSPEIVIRKIVQSISFLAKWMVKSLGLENQEIIVSGGFFDNDLINQFFADCIGETVSLIKNENLSTKGVGLNLINLNQKLVVKMQVYEPQNNYQQLYYQWEKTIWSPKERKWKTY